MPEMPELQVLAETLDARLAGSVITAGQLVAFSALKTYAPPLEALAGLVIAGVGRRGKLIDVDASGLHLVFHLARAGWVTWHDRVPAGAPRPGRSGLALRITLDDGAGFSLTEAGTQRSLAVYVVEDPQGVPGIARLGPEPLSDAFTVEVLAGILRDAAGSQLKGILRDQSRIAGIGNAWSDEILHAAKLSPFTPASSLDAGAIAALHGHIQQVLGDAIAALRGLELADLKDGKRSGMNVHGRTGQPCPVCGTTVAEVSFADSSLQYCPRCQTGGRLLADRRMSRLLK